MLATHHSVPLKQVMQEAMQAFAADMELLSETEKEEAELLKKAAQK